MGRAGDVLEPGGLPAVLGEELAGHQQQGRPRPLGLEGLLGVFDWSNTCLAEPAYDVAATLARLTSRLPNLPHALDRITRVVQVQLERRYLRSYCGRRPLDLARVRYYEACWILSELSWSGMRLRAGGVHTDAVEHRWLHRDAIETGVARFHEISGVELVPLLPNSPS